MKLEIRSAEQIAQWLAAPQPAVFQKVDLRPYASIEHAPLAGCAFIGCEMASTLATAAAEAQCLILPPVRPSKEAPFDPYTIGLYSPGELYDGYDPADPATYDTYPDRRIYLSYMDANKQLVPVSADVLLLRRMHDATVAAALEPFVASFGKKIVAIMGGHDRARGDAIYNDVARLALKLAQAGLVVATGGGPGLMEAANLGAYCAGFANPQGTLDDALAELPDPAFNPLKPDWSLWLQRGFLVWRSMGKPLDAHKARSLGIPTWFYGHEPPNLFATDVAKYFENSVREEGLLAIARGGIIFAEGNAGTVQEIFQDACQNYYRTYDKLKSPMVLLGKDYWDPVDMVFDDPKDKRKKVYPLLLKLAKEKKFDDYLHISDSVQEAVEFILAHPPVEA